MVYKGQKNDFEQFLGRFFTPKIDFEKWVGIPKIGSKKPNSEKKPC